MFENIISFFKKLGKKEETQKPQENNSKDAAKERLHLVLMQDRANVSVDFLELMKQEIIDVIKKYIEVDEKEIDVRLTNQENADGTNGAPALYANIPIINIKNDARKIGKKELEEKAKQQNNEEPKEQNIKEVVETTAKVEPSTENVEVEETTTSVEVETNTEKEENKKAEDKTNTTQEKNKETEKETDTTKETKEQKEEAKKIKNIIDGVIANAESNREKSN